MPDSGWNWRTQLWVTDVKPYPKSLKDFTLACCLKECRLLRDKVKPQTTPDPESHSVVPSFNKVFAMELTRNPVSRCASVLIHFGQTSSILGFGLSAATAVDQGDIQFLHHKVVCLIVQQVAQTSLGFSRLLRMTLNSRSSCLYFSSAWIAGIHYPASRSEVFILKFYLLLLYTCMHIFWKYRVFLLSAHRGQNQVQGPLEPELQMVVSHHVVLGTESLLCARARHTWNHRAISSALIAMF